MKHGWKQLGICLLAMLMLAPMLLDAKPTVADSNYEFKVETIYYQNQEDGQMQAALRGIPYEKAGTTYVAVWHFSDELYVKDTGGSFRQLNKEYVIMDNYSIRSLSGGSIQTSKTKCPKKGETYIGMFFDSEGKAKSAKMKAGSVIKDFEDGRAFVLLEVIEDEGLANADYRRMPGLVVTNDSKATLTGIFGYDAEQNVYWMYIDWFDAGVYGEKSSTPKPAATATPKPAATATSASGVGLASPTPSTEATAEPTEASTAEPTKASTAEPTAKPTESPTPTKKPGPIGCNGGDGSCNGWVIGIIFIVGVFLSGVAVLVILLIVVRRKRRTPVNPTPDNGRMNGPTLPIPEPMPQPMPPKPSERSAHRYKLSLHGGYMDGRTYPINARITIGRGSDNMVAYPEDYAGISRHHAVIWEQDGKLYIRDLSSTGTYLARTRSKLPSQTTVSLQPGDVLYLAERKNMVKILADDQ